MTNPDAVFFLLQANLATDSAPSLLPPTADPRQSSIAEGVRFAKGNNLLGVMCNAAILERVPELVPSIKAAGMVLITLGQPTAKLRVPETAGHLLGAPALSFGDALDGFLDENIIECTK